jgi:hypothetical protein
MDVQIRAMNMMRVSTTFLLGVCLCLAVAPAHSQSPANSAYTEVFYPSGSLRIHAFLHKPTVTVPFQSSSTITARAPDARGARSRTSISAGC